MALAGGFSPVLAKHSKSFSLIACVSVGADRIIVLSCGEVSTFVAASSEASNRYTVGNRKRPRIAAVPSPSQQTRSGITSRVFQVLISLLLGLLGLCLAIGSRPQALNRLSQAHSLCASCLRTSSCWAVGAASRCRPRHIALQTGEADAQVLAYVGRGHALSPILEPGTTLFSRHPLNHLQFVRQLAVLRQQVAYRLMPRSIIATTFHALVVSGAHVAARAMAVLRQR